MVGPALVRLDTSSRPDPDKRDQRPCDEETRYAADEHRPFMHTSVNRMTPHLLEALSGLKHVFHHEVDDVPSGEVRGAAFSAAFVSG